MFGYSAVVLYTAEFWVLYIVVKKFVSVDKTAELARVIFLRINISSSALVPKNVFYEGK